MEAKVLLLADKQSMLCNALADGLKKEKIEIVRGTTDKEKLEQLADAPSLVVFYLQNATDETGKDSGMANVLNYIRGRAEKGQAMGLFLVGMADELANAKTFFPAEYIRGMFLRPFRTDELADAIRTECGDGRKEPQKSILIVDDDPTMLRSLKAMFSEKYKVFTANSGMNAIQLLLKMPVDLILLDYEMPIVKGPQILEMIRSEEQLKDIPVMFLTAKSDRQTISEVLSLKPENYLMKSLPQSAILSAIDNFFLKS
ncbi:MAG: response regulator [Lachnospiraceae bacterium]|nr:response regulator [Lachnospiraceae bacterium]